MSMSRKVDKFTSQQQQQQLSNKVTFHFSLEKKLTRKKFYRFIFAADGDERFFWNGPIFQRLQTLQDLVRMK